MIVPSMIVPTKRPRSHHQLEVALHLDIHCHTAAMNHLEGILGLTSPARPTTPKSVGSLHLTHVDRRGLLPPMHAVSGAEES
jgi:hypothetical protein